MTGKRLKVAIVGGGIGGLSAAHAMLQRGIDATVWEQGDPLAETGTGIMVFHNALRQLQRMGLGDALSEVGARIGEGSGFRRMDGSFVSPTVITDSSGWNGMYGMHRADLLRVLAEGLPSGVVRRDHRCIGFQQNASLAQLKFTTGHIETTDVVIAADGIQSSLQQYVVAPAKPEYSGSRAYRGLIPRHLVPNWPNETTEVWMGDGKHFMVYPVRSGRLLNYVGFVPTQNETTESWSAIGDLGELAASFQGWDPRVVGLLDKVESCFWWGLYDRQPLASWTRGRLALLGDAAHPMLPHLGQGANQAIEDGVALAVFLEGRGSAAVTNVLRRYEAFRRKRTDVVQAEARKQGLRLDSRSGSLAQRDREIAIKELRRWLIDYDVEKAAIGEVGARGIS
jgi:salicylate hydroxylase